ncbi:MAG: hypothetical protein AB4080_12010 [Trichodesmium sp.]
MVGLGDRRQETGDRRQETGEMEIIEEVVVKIVPIFFWHNHPQIVAFCSSIDRNKRSFFRPKKAEINIYHCFDI